jgi:peptidoglycan/xylan/chitin deacetylase (PgdA/CDA1 family)
MQPGMGSHVRSTLIRLGFETLYRTSAYAALQPLVQGVGAVLMLHHVRPPRAGEFQPNRLLEVTPEFLTSILERLKAAPVDIVTLDEMHRRMVEGDFARRFVCITFDDGYRDNKEWAYPILARFSAPFCIYVPSAFPERRGRFWWLALEMAIAKSDSVRIEIGGRVHSVACADASAKLAAFRTLYWRLRACAEEAEIHRAVDRLAAAAGVDMTAVTDRLCMGWDEIRALAADPLVTIGTHTVNHVILSKASEDDARRELVDGRRAVEAEIGRPVEHLAYPYGARDTAGEREFRLAAELGFKTAVTTRPGVLFAGHRGHMTALPRLSLNGEYQDMRYFEVLLSGAATAVANGFRRVDAA